jgi:hypothetical protein
MPYEARSSILNLKREKLRENIKGRVSRDFRTPVFLLNCTPGSSDSWAKTVLHIDSNSRRYSIFLLDNAKPKILFYCHGVGKITYDRFL